MNFDDLTQSMKSTLLYLEDRTVNTTNAVLEGARMNGEDFDNINQFEDHDLLNVERLPASELTEKRVEPTHRVTTFTDKAWELAAQARKERGNRHIDTET